MLKWLTKDGAYQDAYDVGEVARLKGYGWEEIPGTPFQHVQAQRKANASVDTPVGGTDSVVEEEQKRKPGRPKKEA